MVGKADIIKQFSPVLDGLGGGITGYGCRQGILGEDHVVSQPTIIKTE